MNQLPTSTSSDAIDRIPVSACIISYNEADRISECLRSLQFCDDIVVVDSGSTDTTCSVARELGARVLHRRFDGFRQQKDYAVAQARHEWVLCLDADERVGDKLRASILASHAAGLERHAGYRFARLSWYFGRFLRHGTAYPDRVLRLFDRRRGGWRGKREVHESVSLDGPVATLDGDLLHFPYRSLAQVLAKKQQYACMMAQHDHDCGKRASLTRVLLSPAWRFFRSFVLQRGFLDGWPGLIEACISANYVRQKSIMLWLLQHGQPLATPTYRD